MESIIRHVSTFKAYGHAVSDHIYQIVKFSLKNWSKLVSNDLTVFVCSVPPMSIVLKISLVYLIVHIRKAKVKQSDACYGKL